MKAEKKVVLITGANSGIGFEAASTLALNSSNFEVIMSCRSSENGLDITSQESIDTAKNHVKNTYGRLDALINNAGIFVTRDLPLIEQLGETFETNTFGPALVTEAFEPLLKESRSPLVVYVSGYAGSVTSRSDPSHQWYRARRDPYRMSKAAMNMLSACHKANFARWGCRVCAFNPGYTLTNLTGPQSYDLRRQWGAREAEYAAGFLVDIILGLKDTDIAKTGEQSGMLDIDVGVAPW